MAGIPKQTPEEMIENDPMKSFDPEAEDCDVSAKKEEDDSLGLSFTNE